MKKSPRTIDCTTEHFVLVVVRTIASLQHAFIPSCTVHANGNLVPQDEEQENRGY